MTTKKTKKPTYRDLESRIKTQAELLELLRRDHSNLYKQHEELKKKSQERIDTAMLDARNKLAYSLGQMTEAISKAITVIVGKEVM